MNKHDWVYVGGNYDSLWFYCSRCGDKRTDVGGMLTVPEIREKHIKETEGETSGGCKMKVYEDERCKPFEGDHILKRVESQYETISCPRCSGHILVPLNFISNRTYDRVKDEIQRELHMDMGRTKLYHALTDCYHDITQYVLGKDYYTVNPDVYNSNKEICEDIKFKFKTLNKTLKFFKWTTTISTTLLILSLIGRFM